MKQQSLISFKIKPEFKAHVESEARRRGLPVSAYIKAVLAKFSKYKEKPIV